MNIKEYLANKKTSTLEEFSCLVKELPNENPSKEDLVAFALEIANDMSSIYSKGFEDCIAELDKVDANFMSRRKPPHLK
jgi:hypothetical protein